MPSHLGASGALYALMTYYILLNPKSTVYLYFLIPMPAIALAGLVIFFELFSGSERGHLGGAAGGALLWLLRFKL